MPTGRKPHGCDQDLRSFGRRRGRKLSDRQSHLMGNVLPQVSLVLERPCQSTTNLFPIKVEEVWLEVGFGGGEHLIAQARRNPAVGIIGCEPFVDGVVKVLDAIDSLQLRNILIHADDVRPLLRWLPQDSIDRAFVLFPDPWPKRRHVKRRLVGPAFLDLLARVMRPGAELRAATDIADYARTILLAHAKSRHFDWLAASAGDWRLPPPDWVETRYQQKAISEGRRTTYLLFKRNDSRVSSSER